MKFAIVAIRDRALDAFQNPIAVQAAGIAVRSFGDEINNRESPMNQHPDDYDLYQLGTFDTDTGAIESDGGPRMIAVGKDQVRSA